MSGPPRLWVIDPSVAYPEDEGVAELVAGWSGEVRLFRPALEPGEGPGPSTGYEAEGVVVLGSRCSVHDDLRWMRDLSAWLRPIVRGDVQRPLLGICFGHQLIAHLAGARVGFVHEDGSKIVGVATSRCAGGRLIPGPRSLRVVVSHREHVQGLPAGWRVTATRPGIENDGIEHEQLPLAGFQFHPEARESFARRNGIDTAEIDVRLREDNGALLSAFRHLVTRRASLP